MKKKDEQRQEKVNEVRLTRGQYTWEILKTVFSLTFVKHVAMLFAFYVFNYVRPRRLAHIGKCCHISPTALIRYPQNVYIGDHCLLNHNNILQAGKKNAVIRLGNYVMVGPNVQMFSYNHGMDMSDTPMIEQAYTEADIIIEDDVWIGADATILAGAHIEKGVVVAAGSVVNGRLPAYAICGGIPAKPIKARS